MKMKINKINKPFVIAEAGSNFNQSLKFGKKLIQRAKKCGASAVKFQLFKAEKLYPDNKKMYKIFKKIELSEKMFKKFKEFGDKIKIDVFASAFDIESLKFLEKCEIKYHKVASSELTNIKLLKFLSKTNKILFVSVFFSTNETKIKDTIIVNIPKVAIVIHRLTCSSALTENQYFRRMIPEPISILSNSGVVCKNSMYSLSLQKPITFSTPARLYQLRSKRTISPAEGKCATYL